MSRTTLPLLARDVSQMARHMARELESCDAAPSHVQMLNMLARSAGYRNFQHLRAQWDAETRLSQPPPPPPEPVDHRRVLRVGRHFDGDGQLLRWPKKAGERLLCLWALWAAIPAGRTFAEAGINLILCRALCDHGLMERTSDGRVYRRVERPPPADARALIRHLRQRR